VTGYIEKARATKAITIGRQLQMAAMWSYSEMGNSFNSNNLLETIRIVTGNASITSSSIIVVNSKKVSITYSSESKYYILSIDTDLTNYTIVCDGTSIFTGN
jgi:type IV pilus assembly protein PilA